MSNTHSKKSKTEFFFRHHPVFRHDEFVKYLQDQGAYKTVNCEAMLAYHVRNGHLLHLRRGLYAVVPFDTNAKTYKPPALLVASKLTKDAVVSHHSALEFHGLAYALHFHHQYLTKLTRQPFRSQGDIFVPVSVPRVLINKGKTNWGVDIKPFQGTTIQVTSVERTMVDCLARPDVAGGWREIWDCLDMCDYFRVEAIIEYTLLFDSATLAAKVGYYLEQHRDSLDVKDAHLDSLKHHVPRNPVYLHRKFRDSGNLVKPWNLMVPDHILFDEKEPPD